MFRNFVLSILILALMAGCSGQTSASSPAVAPIPVAPTTNVDSTTSGQPAQNTSNIVIVPNGIPTPPIQSLPNGTPVAPSSFEEDENVQLWNLTTDKKVTIADLFHPTSPGMLVGEVLTLSAADGPLPIGEILALLLIAGTLYYVSTQPMPQIEISTWTNPPAPMSTPMPSMEIPQAYLQSLKDFQPKTGVSRGTDSTKYSDTSWLIVSMPTFCTIWFSASMPKDDWSKLLDFTEEEKTDGNPCNIFTIIKVMLSLGKKAMDAGVGIEFIRRFYLEVFSKVVIDFKVPLDGDFIIKMLGL